jgi:multidrug resistance efflux pump
VAAAVTNVDQAVALCQTNQSLLATSLRSLEIAHRRLDQWEANARGGGGERENAEREWEVSGQSKEAAHAQLAAAKGAVVEAARECSGW